MTASRSSSTCKNKTPEEKHDDQRKKKKKEVPRTQERFQQQAGKCKIVHTGSHTKILKKTKTKTTTKKKTRVPFPTLPHIRPCRFSDRQKRKSHGDNRTIRNEGKKKQLACSSSAPSKSRVKNSDCYVWYFFLSIVCFVVAVNMLTRSSNEKESSSRVKWM